MSCGRQTSATAGRPRAGTESPNPNPPRATSPVFASLCKRQCLALGCNSEPQSAPASESHSQARPKRPRCHRHFAMLAGGGDRQPILVNEQRAHRLSAATTPLCRSTDCYRGSQPPKTHSHIGSACRRTWQSYLPFQPSFKTRQNSQKLRLGVDL